MNPSALNERVTIQQKSVTRAANGEEVVTWSVVCVVSASVTQLRGREFFAGSQMQDAIDVRVVIRYRTDVTRDMRVVRNGTILDIVSVIETDRKTGLELMCMSGVRNGR